MSLFDTIIIVLRKKNNCDHQLLINFLNEFYFVIGMKVKLIDIICHLIVIYYQVAVKQLQVGGATP